LRTRVSINHRAFVKGRLNRSCLYSVVRGDTIQPPAGCPGKRRANEDTHRFELANQETRIGNLTPGNWQTLARESGSHLSRIQPWRCLSGHLAALRADEGLASLLNTMSPECPPGMRKISDGGRTGLPPVLFRHELEQGNQPFVKIDCQFTATQKVEPEQTINLSAWWEGDSK
jgi:hypothetical protein